MRHGISRDRLVHGAGVRELKISEFGDDSVKGYSWMPIHDVEGDAGDGPLFDEELIETSIHFDTEQFQLDGLNLSRLISIRMRLFDSIPCRRVNACWSIAAADPLMVFCCGWMRPASKESAMVRR